MDFDYKKYSLEKLNEWMHDALSCSEATPQEIYDVIKKVVEENYYNYKYHTGRCYELLALLNGNGRGHISIGNYATDPKGNQVKVCDKDDQSPECKGAWNDFWEEHYYPEEHKKSKTYDEMIADGYEMTADGFWIPPQKDKVVKWQLPVQVDGLTGDCFVEFPDDLLEAADLKEGDAVEWIDNNDGSFTLRKSNVK
jgi:hypothetical protein